MTGTRIFFLSLALVSASVLANDPADNELVALPSLQLLPPVSFPLINEEPPADRAAFSPASEDKAEAASEPVKSYPDLWAHLRSGFALPDLEDPLVARHEAWYAARPDYVARMVERSQRYLYFIVAEVEKRGMPLEVALLPMIESAYNPMALSRSRASGIWQFIPSTGKHYGLQQDWWFDARRDIVAATNGALDYLQMLYGLFGDWQLAFAAYNWGEGAVTRAIEHNRRRGKPTDYASLRMPAETRNYVPKLQAVKNIVMHPQAFGLTLASIPDTPYFTTVEVPTEIDVKLAAELAEMPLDEFLSLNPAHNRPVIAGGSTHTLLLPFDRAELFAAKLALVDQPLVSWRAYKLRPHDRIERLAAGCGLSVAALKAVNGVSSRKRIPEGYTLLLPVSNRNEDGAGTLQHAVFRALPIEHATAMHRVKRGETLYTIASDYGVTQPELRAWNALRSDRVSPGMRLRVTHADAAPTRGKHRVATKHVSKAAAASRHKAVKKKRVAAR